MNEREKDRKKVRRKGGRKEERNKVNHIFLSRKITHLKYSTSFITSIALEAKNSSLYTFKVTATLTFS